MRIEAEESLGLTEATASQCHGKLVWKQCDFIREEGGTGTKKGRSGGETREGGSEKEKTKGRK